MLLCPFVAFVDSISVAVVAGNVVIPDIYSVNACGLPCLLPHPNPLQCHEICINSSTMQRLPQLFVCFLFDQAALHRQHQQHKRKSAPLLPMYFACHDSLFLFSASPAAEVASLKASHAALCLQHCISSSRTPKLLQIAANCEPFEIHILKSNDTYPISVMPHPLSFRTCQELRWRQRGHMRTRNNAC